MVTGVVDLVVGSGQRDDSGFYGATIFEGIGNGTFEQASNPIAMSELGVTRGSFVKDLDGDGDLDVASVHRGGGQWEFVVRVRNDDDTLGSPHRITSSISGSSTPPRFLYVVDLDLDDNEDLITNGVEGAGLEVAYGLGDGQFTASELIPLSRNPVSLVTPDLDGDGDPDIVAHSGGEILIRSNSGSRRFDAENSIRLDGVSNISQVNTADWNDDNIPDLLATSHSTNQLVVLTGEGGPFPSFGEHRVPVGNDPNGVASADLNLDGRLDVLVANALSQDVSILLGSAEGLVAESRINPGHSGKLIRSKVIDVNGDGLSDVVTMYDHISTQIHVRLASVSGESNSTAYTIDGQPRDFVIADVNNDGTQDIIVATRESYTVLVGAADGRFDESGSFAHLAGSFPKHLLAADINNDSSIDLIMVRPSDLRRPEQPTLPRGLVVHLGDGEGAFSAALDIPISSAQALDLADVDEDGNLDFLVASSGLEVLFGDGLGGVRSTKTVSSGARISDFEVADLTGEGNLDIVMTHGSSTDASGRGFSTVLYGRGNGTFGVWRVPATIGNGSAVQVADLDGDGLKDLIYASEGGSRMAVRLGGQVDFQPIQVYFTGEAATGQARIDKPQIADMNNDGALDIVVENSGVQGTQDLSVFYGRGDGTFSATEEFEGAWTRTTEYHPVFNVPTRETDELGRVTLYEIDPENGNILSTRRVVGEPDNTSGEDDDVVVVFSYTSRGLVEEVRDPLGRLTQLEYNELGLLVSATVASGTAVEATRRFEYDGAGNLHAFIDENGNRTEYFYDQMNRLIRILEADPDADGPLLQPTTTFGHDEEGNVVSVEDARGNETTYEYDPVDRLTRVIAADFSETKYQYDADGNLIRQIDPLGNVTSFEYDSRGRRTQVTDPAGGTTRFEYDNRNNLISLTDPVGNETQFAFDERNLLVAERDPLSKVTRYTYDAAQNLVAMKDRNNRITRYEYDPLDRLIREVWVSEDPDAANAIAFTYDNNGNLLSAADRFSNLTYLYDARDRVVRTDTTGTPDAPGAQLDYTYDGVGNVTSVTDTIDAVSGATTVYQYDRLNRLVQQSQTGAGVSAKRVDYTYNALGQTTNIDRFADLAATQLVASTSQQFDSLNRITEIRHSNQLEELDFYELAYDQASRITEIRDQVGRISYGYDVTNQLISADHPGDDRDENYSYDLNGNRESSHLHGDGYITADGNRLVSDGTYRYEYDNEGNTVLREDLSTNDRRTFEWDHRNRLIRITDYNGFGTSDLSDDVVVSALGFAYDVLGRRITKSSLGSDEVHFIYDRADVLVDYVERLERRYFHGLGTDQLLAEESAGGELSWPLTDHLGSARTTVASDGEVTDESPYDSFGNLLDEQQSRYGFTSREWDEESQYNFHRARYYDPSLGQMLSEDPIGFLGGDANLRRYSLNNPIGFKDPFGLFSFSDFGNLLSASSAGLSTFAAQRLRQTAFARKFSRIGENLGKPPLTVKVLKDLGQLDQVTRSASNANKLARYADVLGKASGFLSLGIDAYTLIDFAIGRGDFDAEVLSAIVDAGLTSAAFLPESVAGVVAGTEVAIAPVAAAGAGGFALGNLINSIQLNRGCGRPVHHSDFLAEFFLNPSTAF